MLGVTKVGNIDKGHQERIMVIKLVVKAANNEVMIEEGYIIEV